MVKLAKFDVSKDAILIKIKHHEIVFKSGVSIRYKFLILLTLIPVLALGAFIFLAVNVFEKDKVAYVYETTTSVTSNMASMLRNQLNSKLTQIKPAYEEYLVSGKLGLVSETVFHNDPQVEQILVFEKSTTGAFEKKSHLEKTPGSADGLSLSLKELSMGMSGDFLKAIPLGATYVRVGTALFGSRN